MTLVLRMCKSDGSSTNGFKYGQIGDRVKCPDWNSKKKCGNGLHALKEGNGDWGLLNGNDWLIIDADDQIVDIDEEKCKFNTGIILFRGTADDLSKSEFPKKLKLNQKSAYEWSEFIGNKEIMIDKIFDEYLLTNFLFNLEYEEESLLIFKNKIIQILNGIRLISFNRLLLNYIRKIDYYKKINSLNEKLDINYVDLNLLGKIKFYLFNFFNRKLI